MIEITLKFATLGEAAKAINLLADAKERDAMTRSLFDATHPPVIRNKDGSIIRTGSMYHWSPDSIDRDAMHREFAKEMGIGHKLPADWAPDGMTRTKPKPKRKQRKKGGGR